MWDLIVRKETICAAEQWTVSCICKSCRSPLSRHELFAAYFPGIPDDIAEETAMRFARKRLESDVYNFCPVCGTGRDCT